MLHYTGQKSFDKKKMVYFLNEKCSASSIPEQQANFNEVKTRLCYVSFVVVVVNVVVVVLIVVADHKGLVVFDKSLSDTL